MTNKELIELVSCSRDITEEFLSNIEALKETRYKNLKSGDMIAYEDYHDKDLKFVYFVGAYKKVNNQTMEESYEIICYAEGSLYGCQCLYERHYPHIHKVDSFSDEHNGQCIVHQDNPGIVLEAVMGEGNLVGYKLLLGDEKKWVFNPDIF